MARTDPPDAGKGRGAPLAPLDPDLQGLSLVATVADQKTVVAAHSGLDHHPGVDDPDESKALRGHAVSGETGIQEEKSYK